MQPRVEAEIAFWLGRDLAGRTSVWKSSGAPCPGCVSPLEVIDTRFTGWQITVADSIADNASCARVVTGLKDGDLVLAGAVHASLPLQVASTVRARSPHLAPVELRVA